MSRYGQKIKFSVQTEPVDPKYFNQQSFIYSCEQCTHFALKEKECTIGQKTTSYLKENQDKRYTLNGQIAFCRFQEVD